MINLLTIFIFFFFSLSILANPEIRFKYIRGEVKVNNKIISSKNTVILSPFLIETGSNGLAVVTVNDSMTFKLNKDSKIDLKEVFHKKKPPQIDLLMGSIFSFIKKKVHKKDTFRLKVKSTIMGVRGTQFYTSYGNKNNDIWMCVNEGVVTVLQDHAKSKVSVEKGQGVKIIDSVSVSNPTFLPWTKKLNWKIDAKNGDLENKVNIEQAYTDLLDHDYL